MAPLRLYLFEARLGSNEAQERPHNSNKCEVIEAITRASNRPPLSSCFHVVYRSTQTVFASFFRKWVVLNTELFFSSFADDVNYLGNRDFGGPGSPGFPDDPGFPAEDFDNALIASLDMVLATPVIRTPQALERDVVTYHYVDESLENLPPLQKHLMRMGPDNLERLQAVVAEWRAALLAE